MTISQIQISIYWSDLTAKAQDDLIYKINSMGGSLPWEIKADCEELAWNRLDIQERAEK